MKIESISCDKCEKDIERDGASVSVMLREHGGRNYADLCLGCASGLLESLGWTTVKTGENSFFSTRALELR
jgi:hypothetical protein